MLRFLKSYWPKWRAHRQSHSIQSAKKVRTRPNPPRILALCRPKVLKSRPSAHLVTTDSRARTKPHSDRHTGAPPSHIVCAHGRSGEERRGAATRVFFATIDDDDGLDAPQTHHL